MGVRDRLLDEDVAGFNARRSPGEKLDLFAEDLSGLKLPGIDLSGANLDKADLSETDLTGGRLVKAFVSEVDAPGVILAQVLAVMVKMKDADLTGADLRGADFARGDLSGSQLGGSKGAGVRLQGTRLKDVQAAESQWANVDLREANLHDADLSRSDLREAQLSELQAVGARFDGAKLDGAHGEQVELRRASFVGASLVGVKLVGARLEDADLSGADLTDADLSRANLARVKLDGAKLVRTKLGEANLDGASVAGASLDGADLTGVDARALGLDEEALAKLAGWGAGAVEDAEIVYDDAAIVMSGGVACILWINPDGPAGSTLRWELWSGGARSAGGILPMTGASVLHHGVVPWRGGFALVALVERAGGAVVHRWSLQPGGELAAAVVTPLGYDPVVLPVLGVDGERLVMWGLARRGPALVVHRDDGEGFQRSIEQPKPQALGFLGSARPVLLCKAGILMSLTPDGLGVPFRAPDGFPSRVAGAVPVGERLIAVWNAERSGRDKGGLRWRWLGDRVAPDPVPLATGVAAALLDVWPAEDGAHVAWLESAGPKGSRLRITRVPDGDGPVFRIEGPAPELVRWLPPSEAGSDPLLLVGMATGSLVVLGIDGTERLRIG
ncbi:MAG TPA: pentapeptide repeat-containing protein [Myxococcota bacterium]|nr:pentapeptide repeat-containing protein [Myxococcota bacterium]